MSLTEEHTPHGGMLRPPIAEEIESTPRTWRGLSGLRKRAVQAPQVSTSQEWEPVEAGREAILSGYVPNVQHDRLARRGYPDYVLAVGQIGAFIAGQATKHIAAHGGLLLDGTLRDLALFDHTLVDRVDQDDIKQQVERATFAMEDVSLGGIAIIGVLPRDVSLDPRHDGSYDGIVHSNWGVYMPHDLVRSSLVADGNVLAQPYVAGLIDIDDVYYANPAFMQRPPL